jgi:hypothetical protein
MMWLFRDCATNEWCSIHRTLLDGASNQLDRKMLGRARRVAIKLDADEAVTLGLEIVAEATPPAKHLERRLCPMFSDVDQSQLVFDEPAET